MSGDEQEPRAKRGYGNIYTPHAGAMIIHVQRERGLANRTIVLTQKQVRLLRTGATILGVALLVGALSWVYLAAQAARVPFLTRRVAVLQHDVSRLDTLQHALDELDARFRQVQKMMGVSTPTSSVAAPSAVAASKTSTSAPASPATPPRPDAHAAPARATAITAPVAASTTVASSTTAPEPTPTTGNAALSTGGATKSAPSAGDSVAAPTPDLWPLSAGGTLLQASSASAHGVDIGVPAGTLVRAAGAGVVVEVRDDAPQGKLVRISQRGGYESVYATLSDARVAKGDRVARGATIGATSAEGETLPPHLHFELHHDGVDVDPTSLMKQGPAHGDLQ